MKIITKSKKINFEQHLYHNDPFCLLVLMQVTQQVEHFVFQCVNPSSYCACREEQERSRTDEIKAGQRDSSSRLSPFDRDTQLEMGGIYQEDMNEVAWSATKAMCET